MPERNINGISVNFTKIETDIFDFIRQHEEGVTPVEISKHLLSISGKKPSSIDTVKFNLFRIYGLLRENGLNADEIIEVTRENKHLKNSKIINIKINSETQINIP